MESQSIKMEGVNQWQDLQAEEESEEETEEKGGGEGTHLVVHLLPQQTCEHWREKVVNGTSNTTPA